jgi:hypothetical protein
MLYFAFRSPTGGAAAINKIGFPARVMIRFLIMSTSTHSFFGRRLAIGFAPDLKTPHDLSGFPNKLMGMGLMQIGIVRGSGIVDLCPDVMVNIPGRPLERPDCANNVVVCVYERIVMFCQLLFLSLFG